MVKTKKNKKGMAEKVAVKSKGPAKLNPFDIRFTKDKHKVLGKRNRNDVGKPGITRAKAIQKRKDTLLQEYKMKNKTNMYLDKRIGEKDANLSSEDKMIARFTAERMRGSGKTSIFNLGDDFNLTHDGEDINAIDKFDDPKSDDEEQDELLGKKFVDEAHFGGFMSQADDKFKAGKGDSRKEFIENLIRESKKKKAEKRRADEEAEEKTLDLDKSWKELNRSLAGMKRTPEDPEPAVAAAAVPAYDAYDMLVKSLGFEKKEARGGERLKTDDEKLKDEKERLEGLEEDRLRRMRGEPAGGKGHVSVEEMAGDGQGKKRVKISAKEKRRLMKQLRKGEDDPKDDKEDAEEGEEAEDDEESGEESEDEESDEEGEEDEYSDLEESDGEAEADEAEAEGTNEKDEHDSKMDEMKAAASAELPFVIPVPDSYDALCGLLGGRGPEEQATVLDRVLACHHPSLGGDSKPALIGHFKLLLQFLQDTALGLEGPGARAGPTLATLSVLATRLFRLAGLFQQEAAVAVQQVVREKFVEWSEQPRKRFPGLDTVVFLQLVHLLFPTSDYRHPVTTPALTLASAVLSSARPTDRAGVASALLLSTVSLQYVTLSKRLSPELLSCLLGLLYVAGTGHTSRPPPPCKGGALLLLARPATALAPAPLALTEAVSVKDIDDAFRVSAMAAALKLVIKLVDLYRDLPSARQLFAPFEPVLAAVPRQHYPAHLVAALEGAAAVVEGLGGPGARVVRPVRQLAMLRMLEPEVEEGFEPGKKKHTGSRELLEEQKMRHKLKQERKGARKEIRQDSAFLAAQRAGEARGKDRDRQDRTKAIFSGLASQEGDYKKMLKKKKKF